MTFAEILLFNQPWLIAPDALRAIAAAADNRPDLAGVIDIKRMPVEPDPDDEDDIFDDIFSIENGVGVVAINGPMIRKPDFLSRYLFGATDTDAITQAIRMAASRPDVQAIMLDIDSPGGSVVGTPELAQAVADAQQQKPVYAFTSGMCCSAAYWVASQAQSIYCTPSARVGSIGVIQAFIDRSEQFRANGLKMEVFAAGKFKGIGAPGTSLTDAQRAHLQSNIEEIAADFHAAVLARGRQISPDAMEGQDFSGKQAQRMNLASVVQGRDDAMGRLRTFQVSRAMQASRVDTAILAMKPIEDQLQEAVANVQTLEADAQASAALLNEANAQIGTLTAEVSTIRTERDALITERDQISADLTTARRTIESLGVQVKALEAKEQDIETRASLRAAEIVASTGTSAPAKVSPAGEAGASAASAEGTLDQRIAHYNELVKAKQSKAAGDYYRAHIQTLFAR